MIPRSQFPETTYLQLNWTWPALFTLQLRDPSVRVGALSFGMGWLEPGIPSWTPIWFGGILAVTQTRYWAPIWFGCSLKLQ